MAHRRAGGDRRYSCRQLAAVGEDSRGHVSPATYRLRRTTRASLSRPDFEFWSLMSPGTSHLVFRLALRSGAFAQRAARVPFLRARSHRPWPLTTSEPRRMRSLSPHVLHDTACPFVATRRTLRSSYSLPCPFLCCSPGGRPALPQPGVQFQMFSPEVDGALQDTGGANGSEHPGGVSAADAAPGCTSQSSVAPADHGES